MTTTDLIIKKNIYFDIDLDDIKKMLQYNDMSAYKKSIQYFITMTSAIEKDCYIDQSYEIYKVMHREN